MTTRSRRSYDHRIKKQVIFPGNPNLFPELESPPSTARGWIRQGMGDVVALDDEQEVEAELRNRIIKLEYRVEILTAVLRLVLALLRISGFKLELLRLPDAASKRVILGAVERARKSMPLSSALRVLRLSSARYHAWIDGPPR